LEKLKHGAFKAIVWKRKTIT